MTAHLEPRFGALPIGKDESRIVFKILTSMDNKASLVGSTSVSHVATSLQPISRLAFENLIHRPLFFVQMEAKRDISPNNQSLLLLSRSWGYLRRRASRKTPVLGHRKETFAGYLTFK
jgi:hypothetical protein